MIAPARPSLAARQLTIYMQREHICITCNNLMPMTVTKRVVQTELDEPLYDFVVKTAKAKGLTLKEATREALRAWAAVEGDLSWDPLFDPAWGFGGRVKANASEVDKVIYRRRKR